MTKSHRIKATEMGGVSCMSAYYLKFYFPTHTRAHFARQKLQKITKCFQCGYKTKTRLKHRTHYTIFQNRRICASCQLYGLVHYVACAFYPYMNGLRSALVGVAGQAVYMVLACMGV